MKSRRSFKFENRTNTFNYGLNGISLHSVGFELFKKVLPVALGIWLRQHCFVELKFTSKLILCNIYFSA